MHLHLNMLVSDWIIYFLFFCAIGVIVYVQRFAHLREPWRRVFHSRIGMIAAVILFFYVIVGLLDSVHFDVTRMNGSHPTSEVQSVLDLAISSLAKHDEETYSAPFATHSYVKSVMETSKGAELMTYKRLQYGGSHLVNLERKDRDILLRVVKGVAIGLLTLGVMNGVVLLFLKRRGYSFRQILGGKTYLAWREMLFTFSVVWLVVCVLWQLVFAYHIFGTNQVGHDVFYASIKSIRTGLLIGILTTMFMLPFALIFGMSAGFFGGWVDDMIQYLYTTLSSIPGVLLISASILVMQVYISTHAELFPTLIERADARLLALCGILGITSWASLCRLLRAETLKIRELEFVQAAKALGTGKFKIILRHIAPNVMHIVLITIVLDFSALVLAEAVLSYVGVGVDPTTFSWGNLINSSRLELAREPIVWWPLLSALVFMLILVLSANLFSDAVRDALDPRIRS